MNQPGNKNWWGRNWPWAAPVGCLGLLALFAAFAGTIVCLVFGMMKSSAAYKDAVSKAKAHPAVQEAIGTPIDEGLFVSGNINVSGGSGNANLSIPISGPKGKATVHVVALKSAGRWTFSTLVVDIDGTEQSINLLE